VRKGGDLRRAVRENAKERCEGKPSQVDASYPGRMNQPPGIRPLDSERDRPLEIRDEGVAKSRASLFEESDRFEIVGFRGGKNV
jgi:hypothetical protein